MAFVDPIGDMLTRIRNAQMRSLNKVEIPNSKFREKILNVLKQEGFISDYKKSSDINKKNSIYVDLKYYAGKPVINEIKRVSKPGRRVYSSIKNLQKTYNGLGISILSTPRGVLSDNEAREANVGGEILCTVY